MQADAISITYGTNCWTRIPHSADQIRANTRAFLDVVRQGHPETPVVVGSPVLRGDAEEKRNRLGATLRDIRGAIEDVVRERIDDGDKRMRLIEGAGILDETLFLDGIHPNDAGHRAIAATIGPVLAEMVAD
jgi:lysophospholipase L1-like esterase